MEFYARPADVVARELIGRELLVRQAGALTRLPITETEAYLGPHDLACHASKGRTKRTEVMFGPPGTIYMYLIYGMYWMLNIVVEREGYPAAVLIRGASPYDGPGKLTRTLGLDGSYNGRLLTEETGVWISGAPAKPAPQITTTPRIGIAYAGEWVDKPLRFVINHY